MPFKSKAQRRKFAQLLVAGKISNETFEDWNRETGGNKLPERVVHRKARKKTAVKKRPKRKKKKSRKWVGFASPVPTQIRQYFRRWVIWRFIDSQRGGTQEIVSGPFPSYMQPERWRYAALTISSLVARWFIVDFSR
jgi:hypothetical protein